MTKQISFQQVRQSAQAAGLSVARLVGPRTAKIPSATVPGLDYTVWIEDNAAGLCAVCECKDGGRACWHGITALALYAAAQAAAPRPVLYSEAPEEDAAVLYCAGQDAYLLPDADDSAAILAATQARMAEIARKGAEAIAELWG